MKLNIDSSSIEVAVKKATSNTISTTPKTRASNLGIIIIDNNNYIVEFNGTKYPLIFPDNYKPIIIFSTIDNEVWDVGKPSLVTKPKLVSEISKFWSPVYEDMIVSLNIKNNIYIINTIYLEKKAKEVLSKWNTKHSLKIKTKDTDNADS